MIRNTCFLILLLINYSLAMSNDRFAECSETANSIATTYEKIYKEWVVYNKLRDEDSKKSDEQYKKIKKINIAIQDALTMLIDEKKNLMQERLLFIMEI